MTMATKEGKAVRRIQLGRLARAETPVASDGANDEALLDDIEAQERRMAGSRGRGRKRRGPSESEGGGSVAKSPARAKGGLMADATPSASPLLTGFTGFTG
jgi:hypothetical protein